MKPIYSPNVTKLRTVTWWNQTEVILITCLGDARQCMIPKWSSHQTVYLGQPAIIIWKHSNDNNSEYILKLFTVPTLF